MSTAVPLITPRPVVLDTVPNALPLGHEGRMFLLSWLHVDVICGVPITADSWRAAWGRAADYETVHNARAVLAGVTP